MTIKIHLNIIETANTKLTVKPFTLIFFLRVRKLAKRKKFIIFAAYTFDGILFFQSYLPYVFINT